MAAFHNKVTLDLFIHKLYDWEPQTMAELIHLAQSFVNVEDTIIAKRKKKVERADVEYSRYLEQGSRPKKAKIGEKRERDGKKVGLSSGQSSNYKPLNAPLDQVLMQIKDDSSLKWPKKMKGDPSKRNKSMYCCFHQDHGHDIDECYDLKQKIEILIKQGKLNNFLGRDHKDERLPMKGKAEEPLRPPLRERRVIVGGTSN